MEFKKFIKQAKEIRDKYEAKNDKLWGAAEYAQGFVGDVGDLMKLVMAKTGHRKIEGDLGQKLGHELSDCLWSILILADEFDVDLEKEFPKNMKMLKERISKK